MPRICLAILQAEHIQSEWVRGCRLRERRPFRTECTSHEPLLPEEEEQQEWRDSQLKFTKCATAYCPGKEFVEFRMIEIIPNVRDVESRGLLNVK